MTTNLTDGPRGTSQRLNVHLNPPKNRGLQGLLGVIRKLHPYRKLPKLSGIVLGGPAMDASDGIRFRAKRHCEGSIQARGLCACLPMSMEPRVHSALWVHGDKVEIPRWL